MIAQAPLVHETTISRDIKYFKGGDKLSPPENGGSSSQLNSAQTRLLIEHLTDTTYFRYIQKSTR
ncbi:MAG: hypothetical protein ACI9LM_000275 [Alteromonadaceae bacterium]|jgi:hypothetical protein